MMSIIRKLLVWFSGTRFYRWLLVNVIPFVRFSIYYTSFRGNVYQAGYALLRPGDIVVAKDRHKLTTLLIGGDWTHAALCVGKGDGPGFEIAEMTHHNFTHSFFFDVCKESDRVAIFRCRDFDPEYIERMIRRCLSFKSAAYDVEFKLGVKALYCSELVYQSDYERRLRVRLDDIVGLGRQYISPTGLARAANVDLVWDSDSVRPRY